MVPTVTQLLAWARTQASGSQGLEYLQSSPLPLWRTHLPATLAIKGPCHCLSPEGAPITIEHC